VLTDTFYGLELASRTRWQLEVLVVAGGRRHGLAQSLVGTEGFGGRRRVCFGFGVLAWFSPHQTLRHLQSSSHLLSHVHELRGESRHRNTGRRDFNN